MLSAQPLPRLCLDVCSVSGCFGWLLVLAVLMLHLPWTKHGRRTRIASVSCRERLEGNRQSHGNVSSSCVSPAFIPQQLEPHIWVLLTLLRSGLVPGGEEELPPGQVTLAFCVSIASLTSRPIFTNSSLKPGKSRSTGSVTVPLVSCLFIVHGPRFTCLFPYVCIIFLDPALRPHPLPSCLPLPYFASTFVRNIQPWLYR